MKSLKKRIQAGEVVHGCWLSLGNQLTAEMVGQAGFDWVMIDLEHGAGTEADLVSQLLALKNTATTGLVRVESIARERILRVLDMGAEGVMCPQIADLDEAKKAIEGIHYPPHGKRGMVGLSRATGYGTRSKAYYNEARENILGILQVETASVLAQLDDIAVLDGVDVLFIGPGDLTMSLGIYGQFDHPLYREAVAKTITAATNAGKAIGILLFDPADYQMYYQMGIRMIAAGSDAAFVAEGASIMADLLRAKGGSIF